MSSSSTPTLFGSSQTVRGGTQTLVPSGILASLSSLAASALPSGGVTPPTNQSATEPLVQTQTPVLACVPASYNISGGTPPFTVFLISSGEANATVLKTLPDAPAAGEFSWGSDIVPGTSVTFVAKGSDGQTGYSTPVVMQTSDDLSCLPSRKKHTGAIVGGVVGGVLGLALLGLFLWFFAIRPARKKRPPKDSIYEDHDPTLLPGVKPSAPGTYGLDSLDFRPESIEQLQRAREVDLPSYDSSQVARQGTLHRGRPPGAEAADLGSLS